MKIQTTQRIAAACIALAAGAPLSAQQTTAQKQPPMTQQTSKETPKMSQAELQERGRKFREFLEPYFVRARDQDNKLSAPFGFVLKKEAEEFFPIGMSFEDAIVVLKEAGFRIHPRPLKGDSKFHFWFGADLTMPTHKRFLGDITVELEPDQQQLDNVHIKSSAIFVSVSANVQLF